MNKYLLIGLAMMTSLFIACNQDDGDDGNENGNWVSLSDYDGKSRTGAVTFTIDGEAYVGLGTDGDDYFLDFYRYNAENNFWQPNAENGDPIATFPGVGRISAVGFSVDGKGYVGTGYNNDIEDTDEELADFYEYDPSTNTWTQIADFGGGIRYSAVAFSVAGKGYVGTGYDGSSYKDFWSYDPSADSWSVVESGFGSKREGAYAFTIGDIAYVGGGENNGDLVYELHSFDPATGVWTDLSKNSDDDDYTEFITGTGRYDAVSFVMDDIAYITTGLSTSYLTSVVSYDPVNNLWVDDYTPFEGLARSGSVAFVLNNQGFVTTGRSASRYHDDIRGFYPEEEYDEFD